MSNATDKKAERARLTDAILRANEATGDDTFRREIDTVLGWADWPSMHDTDPEPIPVYRDSGPGDPIGCSGHLFDVLFLDDVELTDSLKGTAEQVADWFGMVLAWDKRGAEVMLGNAVDGVAPPSQFEVWRRKQRMAVAS